MKRKRENIEETRLPKLERYARFGAKLSHEDFINELMRQEANRQDFLINTSDVRFNELNLTVNEQSYPLDGISFVTLAERIKVSGDTTISKTGLEEITKNPALFENVCNFFFTQMDKEIQFRTLYGLGIAFPSKHYVRINHLDLLEKSIFPVLSEIFGQEVITTGNFLSKKLMYTFIPIPNAEIEIQRFGGYGDKLVLGIEVKNSEILQNSIDVSFKIMSKMGMGSIILLGKDEDLDTSQRHIGASQEEILAKVQLNVVNMFSEENMEYIYNTIEGVRGLMDISVSEVKGKMLSEEFAKLIGLKKQEANALYEIAKLNKDNSLFGWTVGALTSMTKNRELQQDYERRAGYFMQSYMNKPELREKITETINN